MARPKRVETSERQTVTIRYRLVPSFAVACDDPRLSGTVGTGRTAKVALANLRSEVRRVYPHSAFDIIELPADQTMKEAVSG